MSQPPAMVSVVLQTGVGQGHSLCQRTLSCLHDIPSDFSSAQVVQTRLLGELESLRFDESAIFAVKLAVEEAIANAIRHGNRLDPQRRVRVGWTANSQEVIVSISDDGSGFDPAGVPDPTLPGNLELPHGRGLMLMRAFMSEVAYNQVGNQVWLRRLNNSELPD